MANIKLLLVLSVIVAVGKSDLIPPIPEPPHPNITTPTTTITSSPPSPSPNSTITTQHPTPSPNTTTTTTTQHPPPSPNTTTTKTTTQHPPPSPNTTTTVTTTQHPPPSPNTTTTSTTVAPTTTPKPTPVPEPQTGNWSINYPKSNYTCMIVDAAIQLEIVNSTKKINLPANASYTGSCVNNTDEITFTWGNNSLNMEFLKNVNSSKFELQSISAKLGLNSTTNLTLVHKTPEFGTPLGNSYKCAKVQTLNLTDESNRTIALLHISHVQWQPFANTTGHKFDTAIDCEASPMTSDVVPIVVGCVLAALVIMIMVAYLIARRRCQARGYLSMSRNKRYDQLSSTTCASFQDDNDAVLRRRLLTVQIELSDSVGLAKHNKRYALWWRQTNYYKRDAQADV